MKKCLSQKFIIYQRNSLFQRTASRKIYGKRDTGRSIILNDIFLRTELYQSKYSCTFQKMNRRTGFLTELRIRPKTGNSAQVILKNANCGPSTRRHLRI